MDMAFSTNDYFGDNDIGESNDVLKADCRRCNKISELMCVRCGDCYCSKKCQNLEWPQHRYICFPKPALVKMSSVYTDGEMPVHGTVEPVHLKHQLTIMVNVCREFMQKLEMNSEFKSDNLSSYLRNGNGHSNGTNGFDDIPEVEEKPFSHNNNNNHNYNNPNNRPFKRNNNNNYNNNKNYKNNNSNGNYNNNRNKDQKPKSLIYCPANERIKVGPPPPLVESDLCSTSSNKSEATPLEDDIVYLTSFRSSNRVGVCSQIYQLDGSYQKMLNEIDDYGQNFAALVEQIPTPDTYVLAIRSGKYTRAKVQTQKEPIDPNRIRIDFIDYGNLAYRKLSDLRHITPELMNLPNYTKIVHLHKVDLFNYDNAILSFLSGLEKTFYKLKNVSGPASMNTQYVELYDLETNEKLNEVISKFCTEAKSSTTTTTTGTGGQTNKFRGKNYNNSLAQKQNDGNVSKYSNKSLNERINHEKQNLNNSFNENELSIGNLENEPILKAPFEEINFPITTRNKKAVILDVGLVEHGYISCMLEEHRPMLNRIQTVLAQCEKSDMGYKPKHGEYVIAKFEGDWYRGKVIGVLPNSNQFEICYIDFLNEATLTSEEIRRYPKELNIDCFATLCVISGLPKNITPEIREFLKSELNINEVIEINRVVEIAEDRVALIECNEIMDRLYEKNL